MYLVFKYKKEFSAHGSEFNMGSKMEGSTFIFIYDHSWNYSYFACKENIDIVSSSKRDGKKLRFVMQINFTE